MALVSPELGKDRMRAWARAAFGWHLFWVCSRARPLGCQELLVRSPQRVRGQRGAAGRGAGESGQTGTYTTDVCSEKYRKIIMQI